MLEKIKQAISKIVIWFAGPVIEFVHRAVLQFLKFWRDAPWATKIATLPVLIFALMVYGICKLLKGGLNG